MRDIRLGNDIKVDWYITRKDDQAFSLEGLNVSLYLKSMFGRKPLNDFVITGNIIQWTFFGKDQKSSGKYSLEMVVNEGEKGMITTDACDFVNLVSCSCKLEGGKDEDGVETQTIELESRIDVASGEVVTIVVDSELSETSVNPVQNKVITEELNKKAYKSEIPTKMSQLEQDIEIGGSSATPDWNASEGEEGYIKNRTHYKRIVSEAKPVSDLTTILKPTPESKGKWEFEVDSWDFYPENYDDNLECIKITYHNNVYKVKSLVYTDTGIQMTFNLYEDSVDRESFSYTYDIVGNKVTLTCVGDTEFLPESIQDISYISLSEVYIPDTIARTKDLDPLYEEAEALWENVDRLDGKVTELSTQVGKVSEDVANKVDATYVDNAINAAIGNVIKGEY